MAVLGDGFMEFGPLGDLVASEAAVSPDQARAWIEEVVLKDQVQLRGSDGRLMRYSETPEAASRAAARQAARAAARSAPRYSPLEYRRNRSSGTTKSAPRLPSASDQIWATSYGVHLLDLQKALARQFGILLELSGSSIESLPPALPTTSPAGPIDRMAEFFRAKGHLPEFQELPLATWIARAQLEGITGTRLDWGAAWRIAQQRSHVLPLTGAPELAKQSKRGAPSKAPRAPEGSTPPAQDKKARGT